MQVSVFKSFTLDDNNLLQSIYAERSTNESRQSLSTVYIPNGSIYIFTLQEFLTRNIIPSNGSLPFIMNEIESLDIDTEEDFLLLELLLKHLDK